MPPTTEPPLRVWSVLDRLPGMAAAGYAWRRLLGAEFDALVRLMTPDERPARTVPRFDGVVGEYRVVEHGPGDVVGVGRPGEVPVPLTRDDVTVYRLTPSRLARLAADALGIDPDVAPVDGLANTCRVGLYRPLAGVELAAYLTTQLDASAFRAAVESLHVRAPGGILLLAPTRRHHGAAANELLGRRQGLFLALEESIRPYGAGDWQLTEVAQSAVSGFRAGLLARAAEPERGFVIDRSRFEVRLNGCRCFLGNTREFRAIERLAREPGRFVGTEVLIDEVWDGEDVDPNTIQQAMASLRKKFGKKGLARVRIEGAEGGYYRLVLPE